MRIKQSTLRLLTLLLVLAPVARASTWYVDSVNGNDNNYCTSPQTKCKTIGHAVGLAQAGDSIRVAAGVYPEHLTINVSLTLIGSGANTTAIEGSLAGRVIAVFATTTHVTLSNLTLSYGSITGAEARGGGIYNSGVMTINMCTIANNRVGFGGFGAGIYNTGSLTINNSVVSRNKGALGGGGIYSTGILTINDSALIGNAGGVGGGVQNRGGVYNPGTLTINNSTLAGNVGNGVANVSGTLTINKSTLSANHADNGGAIRNLGTARIINSTLSGNISTYAGGAVYNVAKLAIFNSTLSGNSSAQGGDIFNEGGTATLQNSIVANSLKGGNCGGVIKSLGYNLTSDDSCSFNSNGDLNNVDPQLGPLQNNGGPTQTMALQSGSPAVDAGSPGGCTDGQGHLLGTDQRGEPRPDKEDVGGCDMGAYERQTD